MKPTYKREDLTITEFDKEDVITTSKQEEAAEHDNAYEKISTLRSAPGSWF